MAARDLLSPIDPGLSLALSMVIASTAPLLLLDGDMRLVAASVSFCRAFGVDAHSAVGRHLFDLGDGEWMAPQLRSLMSATASGDAEVEAWEMDLIRDGQGTRRLVLNVQKLAYGAPDQLRLLVSISDVTEARANERNAQTLLRENEARNLELARENEVLLREIRHRVANSLQIIASVLMQSARRTSSEETREQLRDAHLRVLSIADLQQQLAASTQGTVRLREYLTKLCETIGASMIADPERLTMRVTVEDVVIDAGISVSLGLIVTELVINALKHAFPENRGGRIAVDYHTHGAGWALSVSDDGVGMSGRAPQAAIPGLGTSIIGALAHQLRARVEVESLSPGTRASVLNLPIHAPETKLPSSSPSEGSARLPVSP